MPTNRDTLKLKIRGHTPHTAENALFDSADWSLKLISTVLPPPGYSPK